MAEPSPGIPAKKYSPLKQASLLVATGSATLLCGLLLVEGCASLVLFSRSVLRKTSEAENRHVEFDTLLGWINLPDLYIKDMYGDGKYLRTNGQRFRATADNWVHIDIVESLKRLQRQEFESMFITHAIKNYPSSAGHFTEKGNAWVAGLIYERLRGDPRTETLFR